MAYITSLISDIQKLSVTQQEQLFSYLEEILVVGLQVNQVTQEVKEFRFAKGKVCPHCNDEIVSKNGKYKEGIYHIQHINAVHSKLKKWMNRFNGVATKYINN